MVVEAGATETYSIHNLAVTVAVGSSKETKVLSLQWMSYMDVLLRLPPFNLSVAPERPVVIIGRFVCCNRFHGIPLSKPALVSEVSLEAALRLVAYAFQPSNPLPHIFI